MEPDLQNTTPPPPPPPPSTVISSNPIPPPPLPNKSVSPTYPLSSSSPSVTGHRKFPTGIIFVVLIIIVLAVAGFFIFKNSSNLTGFGNVNITYWGLWEPESVMKPLIDDYQRTHPKVKITYVQQSSKEYRERLQTALSQGRGPDIFRLHDSWIPEFKSDLSPVPASVYSAAEFESTFYPTVKNDLRVGSTYVAIPLEFDGLAMYVNDDLLKASGLSIPQNWDDFRKVAQAITRCDTPDGSCTTGSKILISGAAMGTSDNVDHWQDILATLMLQNNVNLNAPAGKSAEDALDYFTIFNRVDHMWDSTLPTSTFQFASGKVGLYFGPSWRTFDIKSQSPNFKFSIYPLPQLPVDSTRGEQPVTWASYWVEGVNKKSAQSQAAWDFLKFLSSKVELQKFNQNAAASGRLFGEPYSRVDIADTISGSPYLGAFINQARQARSWYLASFTPDGPTGINSQLSTYFSNAVNSAVQGGDLSGTVTTLSSGINQVLAKYGLATPVSH